MIEEVRQLKASASCTRWSIAYNIIFVLNLASTPFFAYLTEPFPWRVSPSALRVPASFGMLENETLAYLQLLYNSSTMEGQSSRHDSDANAFGIWREMSLPCEIPQGDAIDYVIQMPASFFFGSGLRRSLIDFLTSNATRRSHLEPWQRCEPSLIMGLTLSSLCIWLEKIQDGQYNVWAATALVDARTTCWVRFVFRSLLTSYVCYVLWTRYYSHYRTLLSNLRHIGLSRRYTRYKVVVGDPAYAILSDPVVSVFMVVDLWAGVGYLGIAVVKVTQFVDPWLYVVGCLYVSRVVWYAYTMMRILSFVVKKRHWEASFQPIDPGFLAICAKIYSGPVVSLMGRTRLVWMIYIAWTLFLPETLQDNAIEGSTATILLFLVFASAPLFFSRCKWPRCIRVHPSHAIRHVVSDYKFNDIKAYILLALSMKKRAKRSTGGSLHALYLENPQYRKLPLFSHRAADCFVLCYTSDGHLDESVRLSLLSCLDAQDPKLAISTCTSLHSKAVSMINHESCAPGLPPPESKCIKYIHPGSSNCQWVM